MLSLIQQHTRKIYNLDNEHYVSQVVPARELLVSQRFDLFAKLFYIKNRVQNKNDAVKIYTEHIKAFNNGKEPGREDKNDYNDFIITFNDLIDCFEKEDFDASVSIIPVDGDGIILDGAHRIAALAYYNKTVTIAKFTNVKCKVDFDYVYFKNRGLAWSLMDIIALEMLNWVPNLFVACLWPKLNYQQKEHACQIINRHYQIAYKKTVKVSMNSLTKFVGQIYSSQKWTESIDAVYDKSIRCSGSSRKIELIFFCSEDNIENIINIKDQIRVIFDNGKDSLHITDNTEETQQIGSLVLDKEIFNSWNNAVSKPFGKLKERIKERIFYFKKKQWIDFKVRVARLLRKLKIR